MPQNQQLLDELNAGRRWFFARKTHPIHARRLTDPHEIETVEGPVHVEAGNYLCRGVENELWPQSGETLNAKYAPSGEVDEAGWQLYLPLPEASGVQAAQISHPFFVDSAWGTLHGKPGDYLVKHDSDADTDYPDDLWIVSQHLFHSTYERLVD